ncbi:epimerase [Ktedonobacter sp. SOSP1-85]|uniref:PhzF family phenazine biosynthesis protein n=1 Tax=Ktedonobacter sp. SOSP1-85 TaxID=2778367 RepID=UPI00191552D4|nr:PhzF family phenazine biosynthesis protein [Ktedonobacter sp. SOSP1-85]GHO76853.1 epimerase [Ktedonobacter sp. SOSP1-85]
MREQHIRFYIVDVFAQEPLNGNPLALVVNAQDLSQETMQRIAREFNQSETTFLLPPTRQEANWRLRSFTPVGIEVGGAGHNALGAWWWLAEAGQLELSGPQTTFQQEIGEQVLEVEVLAEKRREGAPWEPTTIGMRQTAPSFGDTHKNPVELAAALGLEVADLAVEGLPAQVVSTGAAHLLVPVQNREAIRRAQPDAKRLYQHLHSVGGQGCYLFSLDPVDPDAAAHTRFFNPTEGIVEDPATGTAAGPLACYLAKYGRISSSGTVTIEQGYELMRPSRIEIRLHGDEVRIFGAGVTVAEGVLRL